MRPALEAAHDEGEARGGLGEVGGVDLRDVAQAHDLGAGARAGDERAHLLRGQVLRLIEDHEAVEESPAAHEVQRADLDAVAQEILRRLPAPAAALGAVGEHLEVVHQGAHPGLHLLFLGARQETDVLAERDRHAGHDDLREAVLFESLHKAGREREQGLAGAGGPQDGNEVDVGVGQQVERVVLLAVARADAPDTVAFAAEIADQFQGRRVALHAAHHRLDAALAVLVHELVGRPLRDRGP